ncbi:hypothetical protein ACJJTC_009747 [Scirpophaga incertulas]
MSWGRSCEKRVQWAEREAELLHSVNSAQPLDPNPRGQAEVLLIDGQSPPHVQSPHQRRSTISLRPTCRARIIAAPPTTKWIVVDRACITRNQWSTISLRHKVVSPHHRSRLLFWKPNLADYNSTFHQPHHQVFINIATISNAI